MKTRLPAFDVLAEMARNDPEGLETLRRSLTEAVIESASNEQTRKRLKGLQFRVDMERQRASTALLAAIRISEMMCRSLADLHRSLVMPFIGSGEEQETVDRAPGNATVLKFPEKSTRRLAEDFQRF
ncbi:MAG: DUF3135 domain-containing protein [Gammaproteobacteria bacterium]|nr:DUF3135 domain-containing protein [Gammaproteobacteria bacterium]